MSREFIMILIIATVFFIMATVIGAHPWTTFQGEKEYLPTEPTLKKLCDEFQEKTGRTAEPSCSVQASKFVNAINEEISFRDLVDAVSYYVPIDTALFWSKISPADPKCGSHFQEKVHISQNISIGYMANALVSFHGSNYFWSNASQKFAKKASGTVTAILNSKATPMYDESSVLALYEVPYLSTPPIVTQMIVKVLHFIGDKNQGQSCTSDKSLESLFCDLLRIKVAYHCMDVNIDASEKDCFNSHGGNVMKLDDVYRGVIVWIVLWNIRCYFPSN